MMRSTVYTFLIFFASYLNNYAQETTLTQLVEKLQSHQQNTLQEKVFVHLDRTFYVGGETMWFKAYAVDGYFHRPLDLSKVVYLEVLDRNHKAIIQTKISLKDGHGVGSISIPASLDSDNYTVRAYTSWMKNFSADFYFLQTISIVNVFQRLEEKNKTPDQRLDAQFFPEGGYLVDGIKSKVAFRVTDSSGKGISFTGSLVSKQGDTLATFHPLKFGMGHFTITPRVSEAYRVILKEKNGQLTTVQLPAIQPNGYVLTLSDSTQDQIKVTITGNGISQSPAVYLIAHNREIVKTAAMLKLVNQSASLMLNKKELGDGVVHLTLFNESRQPVCQRLYFNHPEINTSLLMNVDKTVYGNRDKISLQVKLTSDQAQLLNTSLSVFKIDSLQKVYPADIQSYLWLSSDLKGSIESPAYYFSDDHDVAAAMDHLMLTHGWSKFSWEYVLQSEPKTFRFLPEYRGHIIHGKIHNTQTSTPMQGITAYLGTPDKIIHPYMAHCDKSGRFIFETDHLMGDRKLILQTVPHQTNAHIEIESPYSAETSSLKTPYLNLPEKLGELLTQRSISMQAEDIFYHGRVHERLHVEDSSAFYGNATEHYRLDDYTRFPLMEEVLREYVKGVRVRKKDKNTQFKVLDARRISVMENDPLLLLDGVPIFNTETIMEIDPLKINSIDVVTSRYFYGEFNFDGIISLKTYQADLGGIQFDPGTIVLDYEGLQQKKEFYAPKYETAVDRQSRLPDQRNLLMWIGDLTINSESQPVEFYSSDQTGIFQAVVQGISQTGQPVYQTCTFEVKNILH